VEINRGAARYNFVELMRQERFTFTPFLARSRKGAVRLHEKVAYGREAEVPYEEIRAIIKEHATMRDCGNLSPTAIGRIRWCRQ
jgi:hypothetical protein